ncbi:MAG: hypothetical protein IKY52_01460 [Clostridia bacterium]|nr:hypothetical protein [Clostridia bacterium]
MAKAKTGTDLRVASGIKPQTNRYYAKVALRYRMTAVAAGVLLVLFCLAVLVLGGEYITYDNLTYLARDFDLTMDGRSEMAAVISYPRHESMKFAPYKTGMAVAGSDILTIYDSGGIVLSEDTLNYTTPCLAVSDKYVLAYDLGGKNYAVYNTLTRVIRRDTDFKILSADMSDSGAFVLVTRSNETKYVVELYNEALNHTMSVYKDHYVMDAAVRQDGDRLVIVSAVPGQTDFDCEVSLCAAGAGEPLMTVTYGGLMPLDAVFHPDGSFTVLCDGAVLFFDADGNQLRRYALSGMTLVGADMGDGYAALIGAENALGSENRVVVLNAAGEELLSQMYRERMQQVCLTRRADGDPLCAVLTSSAVLSMDESGILSVCLLEDDDVLTLRHASGGVMVCTKDCMYPAVFTEEADNTEKAGGVS